MQRTDGADGEDGEPNIYFVLHTDTPANVASGYDLAD